jgi:uncharacterized protein (DUF2235 family)
MKRIVICADGTWNRRDQLDRRTGKRRPTNVTKLARAVLPQAGDGTHQLVGYFDGLGTGGGVDRFTGGAFGRGIEASVREIYRFLVYNYVRGDEIYLFGFSRGAFTVRTLAGFLHQVGLLQKDDDYFVPEIYACYQSRHVPGSAAWDHAFRRVGKVQPAPPIRMLGVWDTVGALGAPGLLGRLVNGGKYRYHHVGLTPQTAHAFHAMAIDERRRAFQVDAWRRPAGWPGVLKQVWFAGAHGNVGGGQQPDGLANEALHWMAEQAEGLGLELDADYLAYFRPCFNSTLHASMTPAYRLLGAVQRPVGGLVGHGEAIHQSVLDRLAHADCRYAPANLPALAAGPGSLPVAPTTRVSRGRPC